MFEKANILSFIAKSSQDSEFTLSGYYNHLINSKLLANMLVKSERAILVTWSDFPTKLLKAETLLLFSTLKKIKNGKNMLILS